MKKETECLIREKSLLEQLVNERKYTVEVQKKRIANLEYKEFADHSSTNKNLVFVDSREKPASYSSVVSKTNINNSNSCLIIKAAHNNLSNSAIEKYFKKNFTPGSLGVEIIQTKITREGFLLAVLITVVWKN